MRRTLALYGWVLWFFAFATWSAWNAIQEIRLGSDDISAALWVAMTLIFAGRSTHFANLLAKP